MKAHYIPCWGVTLGVFCSMLMAGCVNHISEEEGLSDNGDIPLKFIANIHEMANSRVSGNDFEEKDEVGLFALIGNATIQEERYIDNLHFVYSGGEFVPDESVFYPEDGKMLNLISYYPYQREGVAKGQSIMQVGVETNQDVADSYSRSDFLVATESNVSAKKEAVSLSYNHEFFQLKIAITPKGEETVDNLLAASPKVSICGFYTKAVYDFQENSFSDYSEEKVIIPAGKWETEDNRIVGKKVILIPQETVIQHQYVTIEVGDKTYISLLPSTLQLQSGKQRELEIMYEPTEDILLNKINGVIGSWEDTGNDQIESTTLHKYVDISKLTFENSNVYKVLYGGRQMAEICKEYLVTSDFSSQAIVAYPMTSDNVVDLSHGFVVQLLGKSGNVHGGSVSWNMEDHSLTYVPGTFPPANYVNITSDGKLLLSETVPNDLSPAIVQDDVISDIRGNIIHNYPIVKIGTQYWMKANLETSLYTNGDAIPNIGQVMVEGATGYLLSKAGNYYYSANAVLTQKLAPVGWSMPDWKDWNCLSQYLKGNAAVLKAGSWVPIVVDDKTHDVTEVSNLSDFNGNPVGMYWLDYLLSSMAGKYLSYWTLDEAGTGIAEKIFLLKSDSNGIEQGNMGLTKAYPIRCLRK